jgi:chaperonin GroEL
MIYVKSKAKNIIADKDKLTKLVSETLDKMATIAAATLGPSGRTVLIERDNMAPIATKDGATVIKALGLADAESNTIIEAAKEISINTAKEAGDGTTTAIVLANALVKHGLEYMSKNPKANPQRITRELKECYDKIIIPFLRDCAIVAQDENFLFNVACISANGDEEIARVVVDAVMAAGDDGTVLLEEGQGRDMKVETIDGYITTTGLKEHGQIGPIFINDRAHQQVKLENGHVFLYDGSLTDLKATAILQDCLADEAGQYDGTPVIVFAHEFADIVLEKLAKSVKGGIFVIPVKTPRSGIPNGASMFLHDMAAYTGATVYDAGTIEDMDDEGLGCFKQFKMNMYETFITADPDPVQLNCRITELKAICDAAFSEFDKSFLRAAIGKLTGGVSTIWVGGLSDLEVREKKARVEDAVEAVRSAIAEGVIPGGCATHLKLRQLILSSPDKKDSWGILTDALLAPFIALMNNCGESSDEILDGIVPNADYSLPIRVFDANNHNFVDPFVAGIIEPAKVCRVSIGNALSIASLLMTIGGIVVVPRNSELEAQLEMGQQAFRNMMDTVGQ